MLVPPVLDSVLDSQLLEVDEVVDRCCWSLRGRRRLAMNRRKSSRLPEPARARSAAGLLLLEPARAPALGHG